MLLRINRAGSFIASPEGVTNTQCGKVGAKRYEYFVTIEAGNEHLTDEGYVMENLWVEEYFHRRYVRDGEPCLSCESMAQDAVWHFINLFKTCQDLEHIDLRRILVRIHGSPASFIEAEWTKK